MDLGWTPEVFPELAESWLELDLLFWTEEIESDYRTGELKAQFKPYIWSLMEQFSDNYQQSGIYFTSEVTDGIPWDAAVTKRYDALWTFDAAIIPKDLTDLYLEPNDQVFFYGYYEDNLYLAHKNIWLERPWKDNSD